MAEDRHRRKPTAPWTPCCARLRSSRSPSRRALRRRLPHRSSLRPAFACSPSRRRPGSGTRRSAALGPCASSAPQRLRRRRDRGAGAFTDANLARYAVVVFLLTTGDVLDGAAGGLRALHPRPAAASSASTPRPTPSTTGPGTAAWSARTSRSHPAIQPATVGVADPRHPSTAGLPERWTGPTSGTTSGQPARPFACSRRSTRRPTPRATARWAAITRSPGPRVRRRPRLVHGRRATPRRRTPSRSSAATCSEASATQRARAAEHPLRRDDAEVAPARRGRPLRRLPAVRRAPGRATAGSYARRPDAARRRPRRRDDAALPAGTWTIVVTVENRQSGRRPSSGERFGSVSAADA